MRTWQSETERYRDRVALLSDKLNEFGDVIGELPRAPLSIQLTDIAAIEYQICILIIGAFRSAQQLTSSLYLLWLTGQFLGASLMARLLLEHFGVLAFTRTKVFEKARSGADIEACQRRLSRLLLGSKSGIPMPWSQEPAHVTPINVMDFLREAETLSQGTLAHYNFLCDASHPSYLQHSYLLFSGPDYDNWSNDRFAEQAHKTLAHTLLVSEFAVNAITNEGIRLFTDCLPRIKAELPS
jgi:hypothetical protein